MISILCFSTSVKSDFIKIKEIKNHHIIFCAFDRPPMFEGKTYYTQLLGILSYLTSRIMAASGAYALFKTRGLSVGTYLFSNL